MRFKADKVIIDKNKLIKYLLIERDIDDKSKYLKSKGYTLFNWNKLENDIREAVQNNEALEETGNPFGKIYKIKAKWQGPNGNDLIVVIILMKLNNTDEPRFITLYPDKEGK